MTNSLPVSQASQTTPLGVAPTDISGEWVGRLDGNTGPLSYLMTLVQIGQQVEGTAYAQDLANQQVHVLFKLRGQVNDSIFHFEEYAITDSNPPYGWCLIAGNLALATSANRSVLSGDWAAADKGDPNCTILGKLRLTKTK